MLNVGPSSTTSQDHAVDVSQILKKQKLSIFNGNPLLGEKIYMISPILDTQIPPEKVVLGMFWGSKYLLRRWPWMSRAMSTGNLNFQIGVNPKIMGKPTKSSHV